MFFGGEVWALTAATHSRGQKKKGSPLVLLENTEQALPHLARLLAGVNAAPDTGLLVVIANGRGLGVVGSKTLGEGVGVVIRALDQGLASDVVSHGCLGRVEDLVVGAAGSRVDQTARDTSNEQGVVNLQLHGVLELLLARGEHVVETLSLCNSTGETIQDESDRYGLAECSWESG